MDNMARDAVGIDLGTTNTRIYRFRFTPNFEGCSAPTLVPITYPDYHGFPVSHSESLSSILYLEENSNGTYTPYTGEIAQCLLARNPNHSDTLLFNTKRLMGRDPQPLAGGYTAQDVAEELYRVCFHSIRLHMPRAQPRQVCVTRPAAADPFQVGDTNDCAARALQNYPQTPPPALTPLQEPQAALLSFLYDQLENPELEQQLLQKQQQNGGILHFLVLDIGGGTTDVAIQPVTITGEHGDVAGDEYFTGYTVNFVNRTQDDGRHADTNPNVHFGGLDFDDHASGYLLDKLYTQTSLGDHLLSRNQHQALANLAVVRAKEYKEHEYQTDTQRFASWNPDLSVFGFDGASEITFTRQEYQQWVLPLCGGADVPPRQDTFGNRLPCVYSIVENTLSSSGYSVSDLDYLYVTGGMSRYQDIHDMICREYGERTQVEFSRSPMDDIARGAALYNSYFHVEQDQVHLDSSIMIDRPCGEAIVLAERGKPLPCHGEADGLTISNPIEMTVDILRGTDPMSPRLTHIRTLRCRLPNDKMTAIGTPVTVSYEVTKEQRIHLTLHILDPRNPYDLILNTDMSQEESSGKSTGYWVHINELSKLVPNDYLPDYESQQNYFLYYDLEPKWVQNFRNKFDDLYQKNASPEMYESKLSQHLLLWRRTVGSEINPLEPFLFALKLYDKILTDELGDVSSDYLTAISNALLPYWDHTQDRDNQFVRHILLAWNWPQARAVIIRMYELKPNFTDPVVEEILRARLYNVRDTNQCFHCLLRHPNHQNLSALLQFMIENLSGSAGIHGRNSIRVTQDMKRDFSYTFKHAGSDLQQALISQYETLRTQHRGNNRFLEKLLGSQEINPQHQRLREIFSHYDSSNPTHQIALRSDWNPSDWTHQALCQSINSQELLNSVTSRLESDLNIHEWNRVGVLHWMARSSFPESHNFIRKKLAELEEKWADKHEYPYSWMEYALASNLIDGTPSWERMADTFFKLGKGYGCAREFRRRLGISADGEQWKKLVTSIALELPIPPADETQRQTLRRFFSGIRELYVYPFNIENFPDTLDSVLENALQYASAQDSILLDILIDVLNNLATRETRGRYYNMLLTLYNSPHLSQSFRRRVRELTTALFTEGM